MADQERPGAADEARRTPQCELARKLHLLLDVAVAERGRALTFPEISAAMTERGVKLSRARWTYMKDGYGRLVHDRPLLTALADYFNVDPEYLLGVEDVETPELVGSQLEFVKALRAARVKSFAARMLGDVSPETLEIIVEYLDQDIALHPGGGFIGACLKWESGLFGQEPFGLDVASLPASGWHVRPPSCQRHLVPRPQPQRKAFAAM